MLVALRTEVTSCPHVRPLLDDEAAIVDHPPTVLSPIRLHTPSGELSRFTTLTTFGTAVDITVDVTVDELSIELFWPADDASARRLTGGR